MEPTDPETKAHSMASMTRVVTWNVWKQGGAWRERQEAICRVLREADPDVVTLQQAWRTSGGSQVSEIAATLGFEHVAIAPYGSSARAGDADVELAVISRWPVTHRIAEMFTSETGSTQGRGVLGVQIQHPSGSVPMVTCHLNSNPTGSADRLLEVATVAGVAARLVGESGSRAVVVVTGDLNAEPDSDEVRRLGGLLTAPAVAGLGLVDAWRYAGANPGWTWRRDNPYLPAGTVDGRIDYIFVGLSVGVGSVRVVGAGGVAVGDGEPVWPSTHAGVCADLLLNGRLTR